jgi:hypothetical protein
MLLGTRHPRLRCAAVWCGVTAGCTAAAVAALSGLHPGPHPGPPATLDAALVDVARWAVLGCASWLWLTTTLAVVEARRGCPPAPRTGVRRWVLVACGVAAVSVGAPVATAAPGHHPPAATSLPYPDRAVAPGRPHHRPPSPVSTVVVRPGDSLWLIAARTLGPDPTDTDVTARWHALYAANRARIGPDPDLIEPGLRLLIPGKDPS